MAVSPSRRSAVSRNGPTWLVPNIISKPLAVIPRRPARPALLSRTCSGRSSARKAAAPPRTESRSPRLRARELRRRLPVWRVISPIAARALGSDGQWRTSVPPRAARAWAVASPIPVLAPVIRIVCPSRSGIRKPPGLVGRLDIVGQVGVRHVRVPGLAEDPGAVPPGHLGLRIDDLVGEAGAEWPGPATTGHRADEDVLGPGRGVDEVPGPERPLLPLNQQQALAVQDDEVLLFVLGVVVAGGLARLQDADVDADEGKPALALKAGEGAEVAAAPDGVAGVEDEPPRPLRRQPARGPPQWRLVWHGGHYRRSAVG